MWPESKVLIILLGFFFSPLLSPCASQFHFRILPTCSALAEWIEWNQICVSRVAAVVVKAFHCHPRKQDKDVFMSSVKELLSILTSGKTRVSVLRLPGSADIDLKPGLFPCLTRFVLWAFLSALHEHFKRQKAHLGCPHKVASIRQRQFT